MWCRSCCISPLLACACSKTAHNLPCQDNHQRCTACACHHHGQSKDHQSGLAWYIHQKCTSCHHHGLCKGHQSELSCHIHQPCTSCHHHEQSKGHQRELSCHIHQRCTACHHHGHCKTWHHGELPCHIHQQCTFYPSCMIHPNDFQQEHHMSDMCTS